MAKENVLKFNDAVVKDAALRTKVKNAAKAYEGLDAKALVEKVIIPVATEAGFPFSIEDVEAYDQGINMISKQFSADELDNISGGKIKAGCFLINAGCTVVGEIDDDGGCLVLGLY